MDKKVGYFVGCLVNTIRPEVGKATVRVLRHLGFRVEVVEQKCCGQPFLSTGNLSSLRDLAQFNVNILADTAFDVVTSCPSCAKMLKMEYPRLLNTKKAETVSKRSFDISEYLYRLWEKDELDLDFQPIEMTAVYHAPCHLRSLGDHLVEERLKLMHRVPGFTVEWLDRGCCGMGGTFGLKRDSFGMSMEIGRTLFQAIGEAKPDRVITDCTSCRVQIEQGTGLRVIHPAMVFQEAYRIPSET